MFMLLLSLLLAPQLETVLKYTFNVINKTTAVSLQAKVILISLFKM